MWKVVWLHVLYVIAGLCTCVYYLFNSCLLPKSGKSSKTTPTSSSNHQMSIEEKEISFNTFEEFYEWKEEFETTTRSLFVLKCAPQVSSNGMKVFYYYCNMAGTYKSEGTGKRQLKTQGTAKIGS